MLPFCNGGELFSVVESGGAMDELECRHWFTQVLAGLSYLQSRYICHRDMSLENVLLDGNVSKVRVCGSLILPSLVSVSCGRLTD